MKNNNAHQNSVDKPGQSSDHKRDALDSAMARAGRTYNRWTKEWFEYFMAQKEIKEAY